jgi:hypothetical protein
MPFACHYHGYTNHCERGETVMAGVMQHVIAIPKVQLFYVLCHIHPHSQVNSAEQEAVDQSQDILQ